MSLNSDCNSRDSRISSTIKVASIMMPVTDTSIIQSVGISLSKLPSVDKDDSSLTTNVDPLSSYSPKPTTNIDSNPVNFDIDITVSHIVVDGDKFIDKRYHLKIDNTFTIDDLITKMLSLKDINVYRGRVKFAFSGKQLNLFNVTDKLFDHDIKQDSVISMEFSSIPSSISSNSVSNIKKRVLNDNVVIDMQSDKRIKLNESDQCIPKQINVPIEPSLVPYSSISDRNRMLSKLVLNVAEKKQSNIDLYYGAKIIENMSKVKAKPSVVDDQVIALIVDDPNILKVSFVNRVNKFETAVGHFVFEYINSMKLVFKKRIILSILRE